MYGLQKAILSKTALQLAQKKTLASGRSYQLDVIRVFLRGSKPDAAVASKGERGSPNFE